MRVLQWMLLAVICLGAGLLSGCLKVDAPEKVEINAGADKKESIDVSQRSGDYWKNVGRSYYSE